jgi:uncharacterized protein YndB with AHSA1/START domain
VSAIHIVRDYPHPPEKVWQAVTDPELVPLWTATGAGGRPEGFALIVGTKFQLIGKPKPGWNGIVDCVVLEVDAPHLLCYSWTDNGGGETTKFGYRIEPYAGGTRFTYEHTGFTGIGGLFMSTLLGRVRTKMLTVGLVPAENSVHASQPPAEQAHGLWLMAAA